MKHRYNDQFSSFPVYTVGLAVDNSYFYTGDKFSHGKTPEGNNHLGSYYLNHLINIGLKGSNLLRQGVPVLRRAVTDDIGNKNFFSGQLDRVKELIKQGPGVSHKRPAFLIFPVTRTLSQK